MAGLLALKGDSMKKILMLASIALVAALGCNQSDRTATNEPTRRTEAPPATPTPGASESKTTTSGHPTTMSDADRALAQRVEQTLREDTELASAAQNVQVHSNNGQVTLMGSVNSQQEKTALGNKAQQVTGVTKVDNQLTVASANR
jgi:osmotically-inducible protein OsmY